MLYKAGKTNGYQSFEALRARQPHVPSPPHGDSVVFFRRDKLPASVCKKKKGVNRDFGVFIDEPSVEKEHGHVSSTHGQ